MLLSISTIVNSASNLSFSLINSMMFFTWSLAMYNSIYPDTKSYFNYSKTNPYFNYFCSYLVNRRSNILFFSFEILSISQEMLSSMNFMQYIRPPFGPFHKESPKTINIIFVIFYWNFVCLPKMQFFHDILKIYQIFDIDSAIVFQIIISEFEINDRMITFK